MRKASVGYEEGLRKDLANPDEAAAYLNVALEDGGGFLLALRDIAESRQLTKIAQETNLNRENLYRMLSKRGNPKLSSLKALLDALGLRLAVEVR